MMPMPMPMPRKPARRRAERGVILAESAVLLAVATTLASLLFAASGVAACPSKDGAACAASGGWEQGWIAFRDTNGDGARGLSERVIYRMRSMPDAPRAAAALDAAASYLRISSTTVLNSSTSSKLR